MSYLLDYKYKKEHQGLNETDKYLSKAEILDKLLKYDEALEAYDKVIELNSQCTDAYLGKWYILEEQEKNTEALEVYIKTLELKVPNTDSYIHFHSGNVLDELKRYEEAIVAYDKAIELNPDDVGAYHQRSVCLSLKKHKNKNDKKN